MVAILYFLLFVRFAFSPVDGKADSGPVHAIDFRQTPMVRIDAWKFRAGGESEWSRYEFDDSDWESLNTSEDRVVSKRLPRGTYWLRTKIDIGLIPENQDLMLSLRNVTCAAQIYWDGRFIGTNGRVGPTAEEEQSGRYLYEVRIPPELVRRGQHVIALCISSHCRPPKIDLVTLGLEEAIQKARLKYNNANVFITAFLITTALLNLILFFGFDRNVAYLFLFLYCVFHTVKILLLPSWLFSESDFVSVQFNERLLYLFVMLGVVSLIAFLLYEFPISRKKIYLLLATTVSLFCYFTILERIYFPASVAVAFGIAIFAAYKKWEGSWMILSGLVGLSVGSYLWYRGIFSFGYFAGIMFFIAAMTIALGRQIARQNRLRHEAVLRSSRLENELLKKNIQPHFVMNSLTSIQELIDTDSAKASELIDALAEEFRMFSKISGNKLVPLIDEIEICKTHLKIMEFRKNSHFTLVVDGLDGTERVPPGVFHTLIENGLTHGYSRKNQGCFRLSKERMPAGVRYQLWNDGEATTVALSDRKGTGMKYVEARLEESYPGRWKVETDSEENGWTVTIDIYDKPYRSHEVM